MTEQVLARIDDLERRTEQIRRELAALRELVQVLQARPSPARPTPAAPVTLRPQPQPRPVPPPLQPRVAPDYASPLRDVIKRATDRTRDVTVADLFGAKALAWAGGVVTILGVVFFFVLAVNRGWIGPELRVTFGGLASAAVLGAGLWLRRRYGETYSSLAAAGAGIAGGYATLLAATALYDLIPKFVALGIAAAIAASGVAVSLAWSAQLVAGLGLIGAIVVPALVAFDGGLTRVGTAFVAIMLAATGVVGVRKRWRELLIVGAAASVPQAAALIADTERLSWLVVAIAAVFWLLLAGIGAYEQLERDRGSVDTLPATFVLGSAGFFVYSAALLFGDRHGGDLQGVAYLVAAAAYAGGAAALRRELGMLLGVLSLSAVAVGLAEILSGASLTYAWAAEGAALAWSAQRFARVRFQLAALAYVVLATGHALLFEASPDHLFEAMRHPAGGVPTIVACAVALLVIALTVGGLEDAQDEEPTGLLRPLGSVLATLRRYEHVVRGTAFTVSALLAVYAASLATLFAYQRSFDDVEHAFDLGHLTLTCAWAVLGLVALVVAVLRRAEVARGLAITWLAFVAVKTAGFDGALLPPLERELPPSFRAYAFLAVAGVFFLATVLLHELDDRVSGISPLAIPGLLLTLVLSIVGGSILAVGSTSEGASVLGAGIALTLVGGLELRLPRLRDFATLLWAVGLGVAAIGEAIMVSGIPRVLIWSATAVLLAGLAHLLSERRLHLAAGAYVLIAAAYMLANETPPSHFFEASAHPGTHLLAAALVVIATAAVAWLVAGDEEWIEIARARTFWVAGILGVYALCLGILEIAERIAPGDDVHTNFQRGHTAVSGFLALLGLSLLYAGLKRHGRALRVGGLALLGVILGKVFLYDLAALSSAARAVSFLAVGGVLLLGGFFYQRLASDGA